MDKYTQLEKINSLKERWILSEEEYAIEKDSILNQSSDKWYKLNTKNHVRNTDNKDLIDKKAKIINENYYTKLLTYHKEDHSFFSLHSFFSAEWRIGRSRFIWLMIINTVLFIILWLLTSTWYQIFWILYLAVVYSWIVICAKRFHDLWLSGWYQLIPLFNIFMTVFIKGDTWDNTYWPSVV